MTDAPSRRRLLRAAAGLGLASGLAGCPLGGTGRAPDTTTRTVPPGTPIECGTELPATITEDSVLQADCTYTIPAGGARNFLEVKNGATLSVQPGAVVEVGAGVRISVKDGTLAARGTDDRPVTFRGTESGAGHWKGIEVNTDADNELRNVRISDVGDVFWNAALVVGRTGTARAAVRGCTVTDSSTAGIKASGEGSLEDFRDNRVANCRGPPLHVHPEQVGALTGTTSFEGNERSYVRVGVGQQGPVDGDATWPTMDVPYRMFGGSTTNTTKVRAAVEIEPGARLEFPENKRLVVQDGGSLVATGERDDGDVERIALVGTADEQGHWGGVVVATTAGANELGHVDLSDGGGAHWDANLAVGVEGTGSVSVHDCEISDSSGWGIRVLDGTLDAENNTFSNNAKGDVTGQDG